MIIGADTSRPSILRWDALLGRTANDRRPDMTDPGPLGARAALETFYYGFNTPDLSALRHVWAPDEHVLLCNPIGGRTVGIEAITALYSRLLLSSDSVWVELSDIIEYRTAESVQFAGREHGAFSIAGEEVTLVIRTTRAFHYRGAAEGWRQVHHHGSIDNPELLAAYQRAVRTSR